MFRSRTLLKREDGFSLVEIIVVVAIMAILVVVAIPVYGAIQANARQTSINEAAQNVHKSIRSIYATQGRAAAITALKKFNSGKDMLFAVADDDRAAYGPGKPSMDPGHRARLETNFASSPSGFTYTSVKADIATNGELENGGDGTYLCVEAVLFGGQTQAQALGFAGESCGAPKP